MTAQRWGPVPVKTLHTVTKVRRAPFFVKEVPCETWSSGP